MPILPRPAQRCTIFADEAAVVWLHGRTAMCRSRRQQGVGPVRPGYVRQVLFFFGLSQLWSVETLLNLTACLLLSLSIAGHVVCGEMLATMFIVNHVRRLLSDGGRVAVFVSCFWCLNQPRSTPSFVALLWSRTVVGGD